MNTGFDHKPTTVPKMCHERNLEKIGELIYVLALRYAMALLEKATALLLLMPIHLECMGGKNEGCGSNTAISNPRIPVRNVSPVPVVISWLGQPLR